MHEITLCQRALELIEQQASAYGAKRVTAVWIKIGAFSCVETSALSFCFDLVCRDTIAEGCNCTSKNRKPNAGVSIVNNMSRC
ncbi:hydrogenase nickel incorporation protein [Salmonella enterica]|nr:hydrogenase nickel incorporation protein [Salmonella enterica]